MRHSMSARGNELVGMACLSAHQAIDTAQALLGGTAVFRFDLT